MFLIRKRRKRINEAKAVLGRNAMECDAVDDAKSSASRYNVGEEI